MKQTKPSGSEQKETAAAVENKGHDKELLIRLKAGDTNAFQQVYYRWKEPLYYFLYKLTGSGQDAEDICQETFVFLWQKRDIIDVEKDVRYLLFLVAKQAAWKQLRRSKQTGSYTDEQDQLSTDNTSHDFVVARETELLAKYAISKLPTKTREIYRLHYEENLSNQQIAEQLGVSQNNVAAQIYAARQRLKEVLLAASLLFFMSW